MIRKRGSKKDNVVKVTFSVAPETDAEAVHLVGDFTEWQGRPMDRQKEGSWRVTVDLEPEREYQFRYLVDGRRWINDPSADRYEPNPFGEDNSVLRT